MSTANGPKLWADILSFFPPGTMIAGGAVRDWYLGKEPKDIDVFVEWGADNDQQLIKYKQVYSRLHDSMVNDYRYVADDCRWALDESQPSAWGADGLLSTYDEDETVINYVEDYIFDKNIKVNVIALNISPLEKFYQFDLGTTRALYDGNLFFTADFVNDMMNKTVTFLNPGKRTQSRAERFVNNNKDFTIVTSPAGTESS